MSWCLGQAAGAGCLHPKTGGFLPKEKKAAAFTGQCAGCMSPPVVSKPEEVLFTSVMTRGQSCDIVSHWLLMMGVYSVVEPR